MGSKERDACRGSNDVDRGGFRQRRAERLFLTARENGRRPPLHLGLRRGATRRAIVLHLPDQLKRQPPVSRGMRPGGFLQGHFIDQAEYFREVPALDALALLNLIDNQQHHDENGAQRLLQIVCGCRRLTEGERHNSQQTVMTRIVHAIFCLQGLSSVNTARFGGAGGLRTKLQARDILFATARASRGA